MIEMEKIISYIPLNWELMKNPYNWVIIALMIALAGVGLLLIMKSTAANEASDIGEV